MSLPNAAGAGKVESALPHVPPEDAIPAKPPTEEDEDFLPPLEELELDTSPEHLPKYDDGFLQQFLQGREALIEQEDSRRADAAFRASLNPIAAEACAIVSRVREHERNTIWSSKNHPQGGVFPGMPFVLAAERVDTTELYKIVRRMPKGGILHAHYEALIDSGWLIDMAMKTSGMCFHASEPLTTPEARRTAIIYFQHTGLTTTDSESIWKEGYKGGSSITVKDAASTFPADAEFPSFKAWVQSRMVVMKNEALAIHEGLDVVWAKFQSTFRIIGSILLYEPILRAALRRLFTELLEDNVFWIELRGVLVAPFFRKGRTVPDKDHVEFFAAIDDEIQDFKKANPRFWGARFIWTSHRRLGTEDLLTDMTRAIQHKVLFPDLIAAYDMVGQETHGRPYVDALPEIFWFRAACAKNGLELPFVFHAGECLGFGDETDQNLFDAILLGTRRLGHAYSLYKHPLLQETVKQKNICVESCPISNEVLRLTHAVEGHPLPAVLANGVHAVISNDDPANILGGATELRNGLSRDFWSVLEGWENLGLAGLGSLAENSVRYALFGPDQNQAEWTKDIKDGINGNGIRAERMRLWRKEWDEFCEWIVTEYAADFGGDDELEA